MIRLAAVRPAVLAASLALAGCIEPPVPTQPISAPAGGPATGPQGALTASRSTVELALNEDRLLGGLLQDQTGREPGAGTVLWQSTNPAVLTVHPTTGQAKAIAPGTAIVTATQVGAMGRAQLEVKVVDKFTVRAITVEPANPVLAIGEKQALRATVAMADGTVSANVTWASSDNTVAAVNPTNGEVTALKEGRVTIEATYALDTKSKGVANVTIVKTKGDAPTTPQPSTVVFGPDTSGPVAFPGRLVAQDSGTTKALRHVDMLDATTGYIAGDGVVLKTTDGGATWTDLTPPDLAGQGPVAVHFLDASRGFVLTESRVLATADGGATWTATPLADANLHTARFTSPNLGAAWGLFDGAYFRTADGGATWSKVVIDVGGGGANVVDVEAQAAGDVALTSHGLYADDPTAGGWTKKGDASGYIDRSNRQQQVALGGSGAVLLMAAHNQQPFLRSLDGGRTWKNEGPPLDAQGQPWKINSTILDVAMASPDVVFLLAGHGVFGSPDGGRRWAPAPGLAYANTPTADFPTAQAGWLVGDGGRILRWTPN